LRPRPIFRWYAYPLHEVERELLMKEIAGCHSRSPGRLRRCARGAVLALAFVAAGATAQTAPPALDVPYVPTPAPVVNAMLKLAQVKRGDVLYDLGSGDGRIVIAAARRYGVRGTGVDIDPQRVREANANARKAGVAKQVRFLNEDLFAIDFSDATVVTLYLLPRINLQLRPKLLAELKPGTRIVSHGFDMGDWQPERVVEVGSSTLYLWIVPPR
jgi:SAM-dependent methyltransferase